MSLPNPPKQLLDYLRNGKAVCFDHHRRRCDICCVDFTYGESDEEDPYGFDNEDGSQGFMSGDEEEHFGDGDDDDEEEGPGRVFVLAKSMARFIPQWDDQILGPQNTYKIEKDYDSPPKPLPLSTVRTTYCSTCQLTWLIGEIGDEAAISHPSHHSYSHIYCGTNRSLLVFIDGACAGNGTRIACGGVGVFYGPGSKFNMSQRLTYPGTATSQKAELAAAALAMETVRSKILPERRIMVKEAKGGHDSRAVADVMGVRLVIVTDSSYIVEGMCRHFSNWKENRQGVLVNKTGKAIENSDGFLKLKSEVEKLSMVGVQVVYYLVGREDTKDADQLARAGVFWILRRESLVKLH